MPIYTYTAEELESLKKKDKTLAAVIDAIGPVERSVEPDLFLSLADSIISQQISGKAAQTVLARLQEATGGITPQSLSALPIEQVQRCGMSMRKAEYLQSAAKAVNSGALDIDALRELPDEEVIARLSELKGIGIWTAEMLMLFSMQRPNVFSYNDLAIQRGLRMIYHHKKITRELFEKYRRRFSPHCSLASLYIWHVSGGALGMKDYAPPTEAEKRRRQKQKQKESGAQKHG